MKAIFTAAATVALSVVCSVWITSIRKVDAQRDKDTVQTKRVEVRDSNNKIRVEIGIANQSGNDVPQIVLRDEKGNIASLLTLDETGNGTLYFSSNGTEGKVALGYLWGSDAKSPGQEDPFGAWGIRVLGQEGVQTTMGILNSGKVIAPKSSSELPSHVP